MFSKQKYELDDKTYNDYEGIEYSSWNVNSDHTLDADKDYVGVAGRYAFRNNVLNHVYARLLVFQDISLMEVQM